MRPSSGPGGRIVVMLLAAVVSGAAAVGTTGSAATSAAETLPAWPSFRGVGASGLASGPQGLPETFDAVGGTNVRWKVRVPGLGHASPVVWGDRIYLATAISSKGDATFRPGLYGDGTASEDKSTHRWVVLALDRTTGRTVWERVAFEGVPVDARHIKSTYASATPATDGRMVVVSFGSQGLAAYDRTGKLKWTQNLGRQNVGAYNAPEIEWGPASSPAIWRDRVFVQVDTSGADFLAALDLATGKVLWQTPREELPSWASPTVVEVDGRAEVVTNAPNFIRGYDALTGAERWRLGGSSKITAPTPFLAGGLIIVASGRAPERPIFAIRPGAAGDITLAPGASQNAHVAWSWTQRGSYMPTPIAVDGLLYVLSNAGLFDCYELATGKEVYRQRLVHRGSGFSASPVEADGRLYLPGEDGDVYVVRAGRTFALEATASAGEPLMATPAIAGGTMYIRGERHLFAVGTTR